MIAGGKNENKRTPKILFMNLHLYYCKLIIVFSGATVWPRWWFWKISGSQEWLVNIRRECTNLLNTKGINHASWNSTAHKMVPIQSRSMHYLVECHRCGLMEDSIRLLLQSECRFCLLLVRLGFQGRQSKVRHGNAKCTV